MVSCVRQQAGNTLRRSRSLPCSLVQTLGADQALRQEETAVGVKAL